MNYNKAIRHYWQQPYGYREVRLLAGVSILDKYKYRHQSTEKQCAICMECQQTQPCQKEIPYEMPHKPWEVFDANIFAVKNNTLLCIIDYYSKFPVVKRRQMAFWLTM